MQLKKIWTAAALCLPLFAQAQFNYANSYFEAGVAGGAMSYSGELTNSLMDFKHMHLAGGVFVRYNAGKYMALRLMGTRGSISGDDKDSKEVRNQIRNLHFKSNITEVSLLADFYLMGYNPEKQYLFSPYVFFGLSVFNFNPKAQHFDPSRRGEWVELAPLNTEGQGSVPSLKDYKLTQVAIPVGLGIKYAVHSHINIGLEFGFRKTFTDYLDDVGQNYAVNVLDPSQSFYDQTPYNDQGNFGGKSEQELMSDRTYEYLVTQRGETFGTASSTFPTDDEYQQAVALRGGQLSRGDRSLDSYMFANIFVSYNFLDNGLVGARNRRKRKAGCPSARF